MARYPDGYNSGRNNKLNVITRTSTSPKKFAPRVQVWSSKGFMYRTHALHAYEMCQTGEAYPDIPTGRIWRVRLAHTASVLGTKIGNNRDNHGRQYATAASVVFEVLGYGEQRLATYSFKPVDPQAVERIRTERNEYHEEQV